MSEKEYWIIILLLVFWLSLLLSERMVKWRRNKKESKRTYCDYCKEEHSKDKFLKDGGCIYSDSDGLEFVRDY